MSLQRRPPKTASVINREIYRLSVARRNASISSIAVEHKDAA
jgi:hypothetical protein